MVYKLEIIYTDYSNPEKIGQSKKFEFNSKQARDTAYDDAKSRIDKEDGTITIKDMTSGGEEIFAYETITSVSKNEHDPEEFSRRINNLRG